MADSSTPVARPQLAGDVGVWCTGEESLRITSVAIAFGMFVTVGVRFQEADRATPQVYNETHDPRDDRTVVTSDHALGAGWLQGLTVSASNGSPPYGEAWVRIDLMRGRGSGATLVHTLVQGYITSQMRRSWPPAALTMAVEGAGALRSVTGTDPAAGAEISETVPTSTRWRVRALSCQLVTDATAANREVSLVIDDGATTIFTSPAGFTHTASLTRRYSAAPIGAQTAPTQGTDRQIVIPDLELPAGARIRTVTTNLQAGDNYGAPQLLLEERLSL